MRSALYCGRLNVKALLVLFLVLVMLGAGGVGAHYWRKHSIARTALAQAHAAVAAGDRANAAKQFRLYLEKYPNDAAVLQEYAELNLAAEPLRPDQIGQAIQAYRRMARLQPDERAPYERLAALYAATSNFTELAHIARKRLEAAPADAQAVLWLTSALAAEHRYREAQEQLLALVNRLQPGDEEFVDACLQLSRIAEADWQGADPARALAWLDQAAAAETAPARALARRARFYREHPDSLPPERAGQWQTLARQDLEAASARQVADPRVCLLLSREWMAHHEYARAEQELEAIAALSPEALREYFLRPADWHILHLVHFVDLALLQEDPQRALPLADDVLGRLQEPGQRLAVLPSAIELYTLAGAQEQARRYLQEFQELRLLAEAGAGFSEAEALLQATLARAEGDSYRVINVLAPFLEQQLQRPRLLRLLAEAFVNTQQTRRAIDAYTRYLRRQPDDQEAALALVRIYMNVGHWSAALEAGRLAAARWSGDSVAQVLLAEARLRAALHSPTIARHTNYDTIEQRLAQLVEENPADANNWVLYAAVALRRGQPQDAETRLQAGLQQADAPLAVRLALARFYFDRGDTPQAIAAARTATEHAPADPESWLGLAHLFEEHGQLDDALAVLEEGRAAVPAGDAQRQLATQAALFSLRNDQRARGLEQLQAVRAAYPRDVLVRSLLLDLPEIQTDAAAAQPIIDEIRALEGESGLRWRAHQAAVWLNAGDAWRTQQREIVQLLDYCLRANPGWEAPVMLLAELHERNGAPEEMEEIYRRTLAANPAATDIADRLLRLLEQQRRFADAQELLDRVEPASVHLPEHRVAVLLGMGQWQDALEHLELKLDENPQDDKSRILLARLRYQQTQDAAAALATLDQLSPAAAATPPAIRARAQILHGAGRTDEARALLDAQVAQAGDAEAYAARAHFLTSAGDFVGAEQDYQKLAALTPDGSGHVLLAGFYARMGRINDAIAAMEAGQAAHPAQARLQRRLVPLLVQRGAPDDLARAASVLQDLERANPEDPEVLWLRAELLLAQGTPASVRAAEQLLERVVRAQPGAVDAYLSLINLAMQRGDPQRARDLAIQARGENPVNNDLLLVRVRAELALGALDRALTLARLALESQPDSSNTCAVFTEVALAHDDPALLEEALTAARQALAAAPHDEQLQRAAARLLAAQGKRAEAIAQLEQYRASSGADAAPDVLLVLSELHYANGDPAAARDVLEAAYAQYPNDMKIRRARILLAGQTGDAARLLALAADLQPRTIPEVSVAIVAASALAATDAPAAQARALELFAAIPPASPDYTGAQLSRALVLYRLDRAAEAAEIYEQILRDEPDNVRALNDYAWVLTSRLERHADAIRLVTEGLRRAPDNPHLLDTRATARMALEQFEEARADLELLLDLPGVSESSRARALLKLAELSRAAGDTRAAGQFAQQVAEIGPTARRFDSAEQERLNRLLQQTP